MFCYKLILIVCFGIVSGEDISPAIDMVLANINDMIEAENKTFLPISDFNKWPIFCNGGTLGNLATIYRAGPVEVIASENEAYIKANLGLQAFLLHYDTCSILKVGHSYLRLEMENLSAMLIVTLKNTNTGCYASLETVKLSLSTPKLYTGENYFHVLEDKIIIWLAEHFEATIIREIYRKLWSLSSRLSNYNVCKTL